MAEIEMSKTAGENGNQPYQGLACKQTNKVLTNLYSTKAVYVAVLFGCSWHTLSISTFSKESDSMLDPTIYFSFMRTLCLKITFYSK